MRPIQLRNTQRHRIKQHLSPLVPIVLPSMLPVVPLNQSWELTISVPPQTGVFVVARVKALLDPLEGWDLLEETGDDAAHAGDVLQLRNIRASNTAQLKTHVA